MSKQHSAQVRGNLEKLTIRFFLLALFGVPFLLVGSVPFILFFMGMLGSKPEDAARIDAAKFSPILGPLLLFSAIGFFLIKLGIDFYK
jgi:hypothetical protein